ncbi:hypothetical protein CAOG_01940 [Capsaspora owczarzaki ATCC 30864]|uniref:hypothetical protein n=1 Tax=Capsaspora owczarzaki (strain ATCC 30864) TaxID=595528 RepID=UPI0001FE6377|nr:hypothetical protein CAOG_01940 [Capsaspora owczarzaki ATCC 30864]|eukprot:XP_004364808.1 hypothetical protein CAOG_01940 [Capsaspora owczarzaki ATCC 30864]
MPCAPSGVAATAGSSSGASTPMSMLASLSFPRSDAPTHGGTESPGPTAFFGRSRTVSQSSQSSGIKLTHTLRPGTGQSARHPYAGGSFVSAGPSSTYSTRHFSQPTSAEAETEDSTAAFRTNWLLQHAATATQLAPSHSMTPGSGEDSDYHMATSDGGSIVREDAIPERAEDEATMMDS